MFPSPLGASYFQMGYVFMTCDVKAGFPSPLGASYFQIKALQLLKAGIARKFPSPLGASYFQIVSKIHGGKWAVVVFPSPLGASYFQIQSNEIKTLEYKISVPSRGILFSNSRNGKNI